LGLKFVRLRASGSINSSDSRDRLLLANKARADQQ
jgi:hypothetical protein